jgi:hypothetical protein
MKKNIIAKFAFGEAVADGIGAVCVELTPGGSYRVFVNGGSLPDGDEKIDFPNIYVALQYACDVCKSLATEV